MIAAIIVIAATFLMAVIVGVLARGGGTMSLEQWSVGGRGFGALFVFVLLAGEIYTTFTFLGASGFAYGRGGAVLYIMTYTCLAFVSSYWLLPPIWKFSKEHKLLSQPDFFARKYESRMLGVIVAVVGLIAMVPYLILQFKGLGIIVQLASYGAVNPATAVTIGAIAMTIYVVASGIHGSAWNAAIKDCTILLMCTFLGVYLPYHYYGGIGAMFEAIEAARPGFLALPATGESPVWYCSTIAISALGLYMWPHTFASIYTSKTAGAFRRNAIFMPLYALVVLLSMLVGFAAVLQVPNLTGGQIDLALLKLSIKTFDPWFVGCIGAAGVLTALVPGSMMLIAASTLVAKNIYREILPSTSERALTVVAKAATPIIAAISVYLTIKGGSSIVALLIMGYSIVTQLFPALVASLVPNSVVTRVGACAGIVAGVITVALVVSLKLDFSSILPGAPSSFKDINAGFIALAINLIVTFGISFVSRPAPLVAPTA